MQSRLAGVAGRVLHHRAARRTLRAFGLLASGFRGEAITLRASALTYLTLLALVPLLAVVYSVVDLFAGEAPIHDRLQSWINSQLGVGAGAAIAGALTTFTSKATVKTLGAIGFMALLVSVISLLWNIESAFNHIYAVRRPRAPLQRLLKYWSFLTLGPIFLTTSLYVTYEISQLNSQHSRAGHSELLHVLAALSSVGITYVGLAFLYKVIPNARVRLRSAAWASFAAGSAWEIAKFLFALASTRMVQVNRIYGSVAVLPITLTWIYISWMIALVGCRLCYALETSRKPEPHVLIAGAAAREGFVARVLLELIQLQRAGRSRLRAGTVARELGCTPRLAREALRALAAAGIVAETRQRGWLPARDPAQVTLAEVRAAARASLAFPSHDDPDRLSQALARLLGSADAAAQSVLSLSVEELLQRDEPSPVDPVPAFDAPRSRA